MTHETVAALGSFLLVGGIIGAIACLTGAALFASNGFSPKLLLAGAAGSILLCAVAFGTILYEAPYVAV
jgi:hypothetical protein